MLVGAVGAAAWLEGGRKWRCRYVLLFGNCELVNLVSAHYKPVPVPVPVPGGAC